MLEMYFVRPQTVDRIRASWIGPEIECYVVWLAEHGYTSRSVVRRVPLLVCFGEFAWLRGARAVGDLAEHVDAFVVERQQRVRRRDARGPQVAKEIRGPVEQLLVVVLPGFVGSGRRHRPDPFVDALPGFFEYLVSERGLRPASIGNYQHHLVGFEAFLGRIGVAQLSELSPVAAGIPAVEHPAVDHVGAGRPGARRRRSSHARWQARLRDLAAAGDLRAAWA